MLLASMVRRRLLDPEDEMPSICPHIRAYRQTLSGGFFLRALNPSNSVHPGPPCDCTFSRGATEADEVGEVGK